MSINNVELCIMRAKAAVKEISTYSQEEIDRAVTAIAWAAYEETNAIRLSEAACDSTGMGNVPSKIIKNRRKTLGTLRDLQGVRTVGVVEENIELGLTKFAKPIGVVCAVTPSTNPTATPVNKAMMAIKGGNAIIVTTSPRAVGPAGMAVDLMRQELDRIKFPVDLVQILPSPISREDTSHLMESCDFICATADTSVVRQAYKTGIPCFGVGSGNVPVLILNGANVKTTAERVIASKTFDNSTSCSSESNLFCDQELFDEFSLALNDNACYVCSEGEAFKVKEVVWLDGKLNRNILGKSANYILEAAGLELEGSKEFSAICLKTSASEIGISPEFGEKMCPVFTLTKISDIAEGLELVNRCLSFAGAGHSLGVHGSDDTDLSQIAKSVNVSRVIFNQAHAFATGGSFENGLNFTLSMGCGTWGKNVSTDNLSYKNFINITTLAITIPENMPSEKDLFSDYL